MQIKTDIKLPNIFKSVFDTSTLKKDNSIGLLIDRQKEKPSLFNYGTYNHNILTKDETVKLNESLDPRYRRLYPSSQDY
jgi:excinuclease UvrABC nuclease subunit